MLRYVILLANVFAGLMLHAQLDSMALRYASSITEAELRTHLTILASDEYMGRDTGKEGQKLAAAYLRRQFERMGIPPIAPIVAPELIDGYFQPFELIEEQGGSIDMVTPAGELAPSKELFYFTESLVEDMVVEELAYMGKALELSGKTQLPANSNVLMFSGEGLPGDVSIMVPMRLTMEWARSKNAKLVIVVVDSVASLITEFGHMAGGGRMRLADGPQSNGERPKAGTQLVLVDKSHVDKLFAKAKYAKIERKRAGTKVRTSFTVRVRPKQNRLVSENVLAYIEGTDKKDELVVLTAHYDHIGVENGVVYNGADDDGSGTVALLEIAQAFAKARAAGHGPRRSILVMPVSGEEKGLLGSRYYSDHPVFPLENTVADLNIDMIGRTDSAHTSSAPYVYVIGSDRLSTELHAANEAANGFAGLILDYTFNATDDPNRFYYRSDHYNFARKGVPSVFYFSGVHVDYHQPGDDVEKIQFDLLRQRALLVFHTAWILANREGRIVVDKP
jgi:hypothetical protein